ncbi:MAG: hypothetical protein Q9167_000925 [Letrouitia subvulpina]
MAFSSLTRLSPCVYLSEPGEDCSSPPNRIPAGQHQPSSGLAAMSMALSLPAPKLIVLSTWMSAQPLHISKYILRYRTLYPSAALLLIRSSPSDFIFRRTSTQYRYLAPAVSKILAVSAKDPDATSPTLSNAQLIIHTFSNGGNLQTVNLIRCYRQSTSQPFPPHIKIFDSCPGKATASGSARALSSALPVHPLLRLPIRLYIYFLVVVYWVMYVPLRLPEPVEANRAAFNNKELMQGEKGRCYVYSDADLMVDWHDVESHVAEARVKGFAVRAERFEGSGHCAHARVGGGDRYWRIVGEMWEGGVGGREQKEK